MFNPGAATMVQWTKLLLEYLHSISECLGSSLPSLLLQVPVKEPGRQSDGSMSFWWSFQCLISSGPTHQSVVHIYASEVVDRRSPSSSLCYSVFQKKLSLPQSSIISGLCFSTRQQHERKKGCIDCVSKERWSGFIIIIIIIIIELERSGTVLPVCVLLPKAQNTSICIRLHGLHRCYYSSFAKLAQKTLPPTQESQIHATSGFFLSIYMH